VGARRVSRPRCFHCASVAQTIALGRALGEAAQAGDVIALHGELGAGKTQLVRGLAEGLGLDPRQVSSPTFVISHEYLPPDNAQRSVLCLIHVDAYRLTGPEELRSIGLGETDDEPLEDSVLVVEWAERVAEALGEDALHVRLEHAEDGRRITLEPRGSWPARLATFHPSERRSDE